MIYLIFLFNVTTLLASFSLLLEFLCQGFSFNIVPLQSSLQHVSQRIPIGHVLLPSGRTLLSLLIYIVVIHVRVLHLLVLLPFFLLNELCKIDIDGLHRAEPPALRTEYEGAADGGGIGGGVCFKCSPVWRQQTLEEGRAAQDGHGVVRGLSSTETSRDRPWIESTAWQSLGIRIIGLPSSSAGV